MFINADSFLLFDLCGWTKEDLAIFCQPCTSWPESDKFNQFCDMLKNMSLLNDNVERQIKVLKDRIRTVHNEDFLQNVIITVAGLRKRCAGFKPSNFNNEELNLALCQILKI